MMCYDSTLYFVDADKADGYVRVAILTGISTIFIDTPLFDSAEDQEMS